MNIIEEHRTEVRTGNITYSIQLTTTPATEPGAPARTSIKVCGVGERGEPVADGGFETDTAEVATVAALLSETLLAHGGMAGGGRRTRPSAASRGRPWTAELDADLERRWLAGEGVAEIAAELGRTPGGIRARLPRVGCDPERVGEYLPRPPSKRAEEESEPW